MSISQSDLSKLTIELEETKSKVKKEKAKRKRRIERLTEEYDSLKKQYDNLLQDNIKKIVSKSDSVNSLLTNSTSSEYDTPGTPSKSFSKAQLTLSVATPPPLRNPKQPPSKSGSNLNLNYGSGE